MVKEKYQQEYDIATEITIDGDRLALDIPDDGTQTDNGWDIVPAQKAHVCPQQSKTLKYSASGFNIASLPMSFGKGLGMRQHFNNECVSILDQETQSG